MKALIGHITSIAGVDHRGFSVSLSHYYVDDSLMQKSEGLLESKVLFISNTQLRP